MSKPPKLHILAFGAHPDDVEIGMAGTIAKYSDKGYQIGICDLTLAELSSNGTVDIRQAEATKASDILGITERINLHMPDRGLYHEEELVKKIVTVIRSYKPKLVFAPYYKDRHPDHGKCMDLVKEAIFSAGIMRYQDDLLQEVHKVTSFYYYMINGFHQPSFVVDITSTMGKKVSSLKAYESQFVKSSTTIDTPLLNDFILSIEAREKLFGKEIGVQYAEGFISPTPLRLDEDLIGEMP